jgi:hypothetical protein
LIKIYFTIRRSGVFDSRYYLKKYLDVARSWNDPIKHFVCHGWQEGRNPNPFFDTKWYLKQYPGINKAKVNPLYHYLKHGAVEGRDPSPHFSTKKYVAENPNLRSSGINPLAHFLKNTTIRHPRDTDSLPDSSLPDNESSFLPREPIGHAQAERIMSSRLISEVHRNIHNELFQRES